MSYSFFLTLTLSVRLLSYLCILLFSHCKRVSIPYILIVPNDCFTLISNGDSFQFKSIFGMTANKALRQILSQIGVCRKSDFLHGQLYVVMSRNGNLERLQNLTKTSNTYITSYIAYPEYIYIMQIFVLSVFESDRYVKQ